MIDDPEAICEARTDAIGHLMHEDLPHVFNRELRSPAFTFIIPRRWWWVWRCSYCGKRAR